MSTICAAARRIAVGAFGLALALVVLPCAALAQQVAVTVNGAPITTYDIEQRTRFKTLSTHKTPARQEIIEELIDDKLKVQVLQSYRLEVTDTEVDTAYANMAKGMRLAPEQLTEALAHAGVDAQTLKASIRAGIAWQQIIRGKFRSSLEVRDKEVARRLRERNEDVSEIGTEYQLRPILLILPAGASAQAVDARKREAEALRARFASCADGLRFARALHDVAVKELIVKPAADLPPPLRKLLDELAVGRLSGPEVTAEGIQMFALCAKRETKSGTAAAREMRDKIFAERFEVVSKRYLAELRRKAIIEVK
jgi:peptidyl-prolyl cis-trans isomerase SurA